MRRTLSALAIACTAASLTTGISTTAGAATAHATSAGCNAITKSLAVGDGFAKATGPKVTPYNYSKLSANPANALGTTIDFGAKALVVSYVSPSDLAKLSVMAQGKNNRR